MADRLHDARDEDAAEQEAAEIGGAHEADGGRRKAFLAPRSAISVPCSPLPPSRMPAAMRSGISGRMEDMKTGDPLAEAPYWGIATSDCQRQWPPALGHAGPLP